jgi:hypothetical protein
MNENNMEPDEVIEEEAIDYFLDENLDEDSQMYLMDIIENDERLADIFETVVMRAIEVSKDGEISGPGNGTSDSIPARLSDGEFVFSADAVEEIGVDKLEAMHTRAKERAGLRGSSKYDQLKKVDSEIDRTEIG